jgi:nucleolar protein 56
MTTERNQVDQESEEEEQPAKKVKLSKEEKKALKKEKKKAAKEAANAEGTDVEKSKVYLYHPFHCASHTLFSF